MTDVGGLRSFIKSFKIQLRVIYALLMREIITRYGRHNIGFAWLFVEPMIFTLGVTALWVATKSAHGNNTIEIVPFAITGYSVVLCWRNAVSKSGHAVEANAGLLYHKNVKAVDVFLSRAFLEIFGATSSFLCLSLFFGFLGHMSVPADFLLLAFGWLLLIWFSLALALTMGSVFQLFKEVYRLWHPFTYVLFPLSGAAFFVVWLPDFAREYALYLPMVHLTEMVRHGYYGDLVQTFEDISYIVWWNLCLSFVGLTLVRRVEKELEVSA